MAITQSITTSFKSEVLQAVHNFASSGGDTFKIALYSSSANLSSATTVYTTSGEITGTGYTAGGKTLTNLGVATSGTTAYSSWSNISWTTSTITASGALIYNASKGNKAVAVLNFGGDYSTTASTFTVTFPSNTSTTAVIIFN